LWIAGRRKAKAEIKAKAECERAETTLCSACSIFEWNKTEQVEHIINQPVNTDKILSVSKQKFGKITLHPHIQQVMKSISCSIFCKTEQETGGS
jgi:hypothetical protein